MELTANSILKQRYASVNKLWIQTKAKGLNDPQISSGDLNWTELIVCGERIPSLREKVVPDAVWGW